MVSLHAFAAGNAGLVVSARFQGDEERLLGQDELSRAVLALILRPSSASAATTVVTGTGGGFQTAAIPELTRSRGQAVLRRHAIDVFGPERVHAVPAAGPIAVLRQGHEVTFILGGGLASAAASAEVEAFAAAPGGGRSLLNAKPTSEASVVLPSSASACSQIPALRSALSALVSGGLAPEAKRQRQATLVLSAALRKLSAIDALATQEGGSSPLSRGELERDRSATQVRAHRLTAEMGTVNAVLTRLGAQLTACSPPPREPAPSPSKAAAAAVTPTASTPTASTPTPTPTPAPPPMVHVVQTDPTLSQFMAAQSAIPMTTTAPSGSGTLIPVNEQTHYQRVAGIGAALTDSAAWLVGENLSSASRLAVLQDLFGSPGGQPGLGAPPIGLSFLRTAIGASGAMTVAGPYSYDDMPPGQSDPTLAHFSIAHDQSYILPTLQQALAIDPRLQILANPWSPPGWMKANDALDNKNDAGTLLAADYGPLANYFVKFIQAYAAAKVPISALTPQNEPRTPPGAGTTYPGLTLPAPNEAQFIAQNLAPTLSAAGLHPKIYGEDGSWDQTPYAGSLAAGPAAADLAGMAWHCYFGSPTGMTQFHQSYPSLDQITDECAPELRSFGTPEYLIASLRNWASTVSVWTLALDQNGGPLQPGNNCGGCTGLLTVNTQTQSVSFRPKYYDLGQVSAFVQPGAVRIDSPSFVTYGLSNSNTFTVSHGLDDVAFENPAGSKVLVANNTSTAAISFTVQSDGRYFGYTLPAGAMTTFTW